MPELSGVEAFHFSIFYFIRLLREHGVLLGLQMRVGISNIVLQARPRLAGLCPQGGSIWMKRQGCSQGCRADGICPSQQALCSAPAKMKPWLLSQPIIQHRVRRAERTPLGRWRREGAFPRCFCLVSSSLRWITISTSRAGPLSCFLDNWLYFLTSPSQLWAVHSLYQKVTRVLIQAINENIWWKNEHRAPRPSSRGLAQADRNHNSFGINVQQATDPLTLLSFTPHFSMRIWGFLMGCLRCFIKSRRTSMLSPHPTVATPDTP